MLNRALFTKIIIDDDETISTTADEPIATIVTTGTGPRPENEESLLRVDAGQGSNFDSYVVSGRFEPALEGIANAFNASFVPPRPSHPCRHQSGPATG